MAQSINLGGSTFLDAGAVDGIKGQLTSGNLNDYKGVHKSGIYFLYNPATSFTNSAVGWCALIVIGAKSSDATVQIEIDNSGLYVRQYTGTPLAWTAWKTIN